MNSRTAHGNCAHALFMALGAACLALTIEAPRAEAVPIGGRLYVTGQDSIWHAGKGTNYTGARNLARGAIDFARGGSTKPFLFVESKTVEPPPGNAREAPYLETALGYASTDFVVMDESDLNALSDFAATLSTYSALVVASDHGGMLTAAELSYLNNQSSAILQYLNNGGGVVAFAQSNAKGLLGSETPFGFIPFLISSTAFHTNETGNTVTAYGKAKFGFTDQDVNGNFSHNYFTASGGMQAVTLLNGIPDAPLTLAYEGQFTSGGVVVSVPEPSVLFTVALGALALMIHRLRGDGARIG